MGKESARADDICEVELMRLRSGMSPRLGEQDLDHAHALAYQFDKCPPILVERTTMTVIDGVHRMLAARILGRRTIAVIFFDGTHEQALAEAVSSNIAHGKPLTLAEREHAAVAFLRLQIAWSDRRIASTCGLSDKTVGRLRKTTADVPQISERLGRDGRRRHIGPTRLRTDISVVTGVQPNANPDEVAEAPSMATTFRDLQEHITKGEHLPRPSDSEKTTDRFGGNARPDRRNNSLRPWGEDRALLAMPNGASFTAWMDQREISSEDWELCLEQIPLGRLAQLADDARARAAEWAKFSAALEARSRTLNRRRGA
jgi:hypothetical protein